MSGNKMIGFEDNSIHLNKAGYEFAIATLDDGAIDGYPSCLMPIWINDDKSNEEIIVAILGSEPKVGKNPEVPIRRNKIYKLVRQNDVV